jgi:hypothetical protein
MLINIIMIMQVSTSCTVIAPISAFSAGSLVVIIIILYYILIYIYI